MELKVGDSHLTGDQECDGARERAERDQRSSDQFNDPAYPKLRSSGWHRVTVPSEYLLCTVKRGHGTRDDAKGCIEIRLYSKREFPDSRRDVGGVHGTVPTLARFRSLE